MNNLNPKPTLNQRSILMQRLKEDEAINKHFDLTNVWELTDRVVSEKQYKYILALIFNGKRAKLNSVLFNLGFPPKL